VASILKGTLKEDKMFSHFWSEKIPIPVGLVYLRSASNKRKYPIANSYRVSEG
jgi:hypothetical protein